MSVAVSLGALGGQVAEFGEWPYVLTVSADGRPHAVSARMVFDGTGFDGTAGRTTMANADARPEAVSLLWAPIEPGGYSLIVDGTATVTDGPLRIVPTRAVLHRTGPETGASDCVRI